MELSIQIYFEYYGKQLELQKFMDIFKKLDKNKFPSPDKSIRSNEN